MNEQYNQKNYILGIINGSLAHLCKSFIHPHLVLAAFVYEQSRSVLMIGVLAAVDSIGLYLPQLYTSSLIEHRITKKPVYMITIALRSLSLVIMIAAIWLSGRYESKPLLFLFLVAYFSYRLAQGSASLPFWDIIGRTIPPSHLGSFIGSRDLFGGMLAMLSGFLIVQPLLISLPYPYNYTGLSILALLVMLPGTGIFYLVHEKENSKPPAPRSLAKTARGSGALLVKSSNYRKLLLFRMLQRLNILSIAFFIPFAAERLGIMGLSGIFLGIVQGARLLSSQVWGRISNRRGNRLLLIWAALFFTLSPLMALLSANCPPLFALSLPWTGQSLDLSFMILLLAIFLFGWGQQANLIGYRAFLIETSPAERRPSYMAFLNTVTLPLAVVAPLLGSILEKEVSRFDRFFGFLVLMGLLNLATAWSIKEVRAGRVVS